MYLKRILSFLLLAPLSLSQLHATENMSPRIINGEKSDIDSWPFMVALVSKHREVNKGLFCGASFLGGRYILTAAHCVDSKEKLDLDAVIGISDLTQNDVTEHRYSVKEIYVHEDYKNVEDGNDIAIIELEKEAAYTSVNLADQYLRNNLPVGETLTVMGWGDQDPAPGRDSTLFKNELYQVNVPLVKQSLCPDSVKNNDNAFCAGFENGGYDSCQGDSGGPIVVASGNGYEQLGVVSWGQGCAEAGNYGVYTNISHFTDWISAKTQGLSYRQSEFVGTKYLGTHSHSFSINNNTDQIVRTSGVTIQGVGASVTANTCSEIAINESCAITVNYNVDKLDAGAVSVKVLTDLPLTPSFDVALSYVGVEAASASLRNMLSIANTEVYVSENAWVKNGSSIETPVLGNGEFAQLTMTGLAPGSLSFNVNISTEKNYDYFNIYINGHFYFRTSGPGSGVITLGLSRNNNTVVLEYKKDDNYSYGNDRVTINKVTHSVDGKSDIPDGHSTSKSSGSSGGAINWISVLSLGMLAFVRRRSV